jgi:hypothetical protein
MKEQHRTTSVLGATAQTGSLVATDLINRGLPVRTACRPGAGTAFNGNGMPAEYGAVLRPLTKTVESGNGSQPNDTVEQVIGTPPRTFRALVRRNAAARDEAAS